MEQGDVLDTEEAVAAEFAFGGPAASYRNQWLCVKAAFTQKNGIVFLGTALGAKSVAAKCTRQGNAAAAPAKKGRGMAAFANLGGGGCQCNLTHHHQLIYEPILHHLNRPFKRFQGVLGAPAGNRACPAPLRARSSAQPATQQCTHPPSARALLLLLLWACGI